MTAESRLRIVDVYPDLLGLYGDRGNVLALAHLARRSGLEVETLEVLAGEDIPDSADIYLLAGGEDQVQVRAAELLRTQPGLRRAIEAGRPCLAVCAGMQLLSHGFGDRDGRPQPGLGVLDVTCGRFEGERPVGEIVQESVDLALPTLTGFENHRGTAELGPDARPLARVRVGWGNGDGYEGAVQGSVIATYLHGPVLVRNPALADHLLSQAVGTPVEHPADEVIGQLRRERIAQALAAQSRRDSRRSRR